ncbi:xanthine dehydrogenase family protein molybdopterin-binding subunit [Roseibacillus ishigakijimensis]|uniref:Xanthine dehydrogenase family protein molybdopterin-binding subunit n=1 Tax=Roseibacillus ishigakijimensis TaxID=454146 RepID=A0A934VM77_9BACT|nr:molybdopterin cofactor-binding domain-containing protein [Roseibacillus ishigakijimensis]MBK1833806.1 xanthine dehydrogenase family protein molybdopterin-binding subunit [Roseibacillus ishigakijimensis]
MKNTTHSLDRRSFLKATTLTGGGLLLSFSQVFLAAEPSATSAEEAPRSIEFNGYIRIAPDNQVTLQAPNPEFGQNVKTSLPMILAEELDVDWNLVTVVQGSFDRELYSRQFAGGSGAVRHGWPILREAGAKVRQMLREAAAQRWEVPVAEVSTEKGHLLHPGTGRKLTYGEVASEAATLPVPDRVSLKAPEQFSLIGKDTRNVDGLAIVTGKAGFGVDYHVEGMLTAMIIHPPAFGMTLKSYDDTAARQMPGVRKIFPIETFNDSHQNRGFDISAFPKLVVIVGDSVWQVMQAKKAIQCEWDTTVDELESSEEHQKRMAEAAAKPARELRRDGNPEEAFAQAAKVIESTYTAPFLAHNTMEPLNFFAHVTDEKVFVAGPLQAPEFAQRALIARLGVAPESIEIEMTRMGGGFGRRAYGHFVVEAALISREMKAPVKLLYTREDDMTFGIYRPAYRIDYKAALDADNKLIAFSVKAGGIPESPLGRSANRFPAGAVENYLAEEWSLDSAITVGAFRAPRSNFMGAAEQAFLDEVALAAGKDPLDFRLELFERAKTAPVGNRNDYDAERYAGVLELVKEKAQWDKPLPAGIHRGVAAYFCHASYAAHVVEVAIEQEKVVVKKVTSAIDCGVVVNPDAAANMVEGAVVDGIGNALFGEMTFVGGQPQKQNYDQYRMIRFRESPMEIDVHFVDNGIDPTGLGEPPFPPVFAAFTNALSRATGKRHFHQPFGLEVTA